MVYYIQLIESTYRGGNYMLSKIKNINTFWGIACTLLLGGLITQLLDSLGVFGTYSVIPLVIGLSIIVVGIVFFAVLGHYNKKK